MINEKDLQNMTKKEIDELTQMINEENERRAKLQYQQIVNEFNKLIEKANELYMNYRVYDEEFCFTKTSLDKNNNLVFEFWD